MPNSKSTEEVPVPAVYGIGNPLMDIIVRADASALEKLGAVPGSMNLVRHADQQAVMQLGRVTGRLPGGSCANTVRGTRWLMRVAGATAGVAYTGAVGNDEEGNAFADLLDKEGVEPFLARTDTPTGTSVIVVTPDSQRTMFTHLGACRDLTSAHVSRSCISGAAILHLTGYMWDTPGQEAAAVEAVRHARESGTSVSLDVADAFVVERYHDTLVDWLPGNVDLLFANEAELRALTGVEEGGEATLRAADRFASVVVMKTGPRGCIVNDHGSIHECPAHPADPVDTTGAGDAFAGGYLFGLTQGLTPAECALIANRLAGGIVTVAGCNYDALDPAEVATVFAKLP
jgi:fructokinase